MRVRAKVNETKLAFVHPGQKASLRIDAFPDRPLMGTVTAVTVIPAPASGPGSDVKVYYANITIDSGGFEGLRTGLSAEVTFFVDKRQSATRVPLESIRWVAGVPYAAVSNSPDLASYRWRKIEVGLMNPDYAEVLGGLKVGDKVVANAQGLVAPVPEPILQASGSGPNQPRR